MDEDKIIIGEKFGPASLPAVEDFCRHERSQVLVIRKYLNGLMRSLKIMASVSH
jgi:hypothetical protein